MIWKLACSHPFMGFPDHIKYFAKGFRVNNTVLTSLFLQFNTLSNFSKYTVQRTEAYSVLCQTSKIECFAKKR